jgi:MFS family permease
MGNGSPRTPVRESRPSAPMISLQRYTRLFAQPDMGRAIIASLIGRLPIGISGLAILLAVQAREASFIDAGLATSAYLAGLAGIAPLVGRLIDRLGPRPVLLVAGLAYPIVLAGLVGALGRELPFALILALSFLAGATLPQVTTCMRTLYRRRLEDDSLLVAALSLDAALIELVFIIGPMFVAFIVATASPVLAVLLGAACAALGVLLITRTPAMTEWPLEDGARRPLLGALHDRGLRRLLAVLFGYASVFGFVDIGIATYAHEAGRPAITGVILGVMSIGTAAGGLAYGSRTWHLPLHRQFWLSLVIMGASIAPLAWIKHPVVLSLMAVASGLTMAPPLIVQSTMVAKWTPTAQMAEAFTWVTTAMLCGVGIGFALGGAVAEASGSVAVLTLAAAVSVLMGVVARSALTRTT